MDENRSYVRPMGDEEKLQCARDDRDTSRMIADKAITRISELSDEFARLEVQMAALLFTFANFFLKDLSGFPGELLMKVAFSTALASLLISLIFGLIHIKRKEQFWTVQLAQKASRNRKWNEVVKRRFSYEEGEAFHKGTAIDDSAISTTPPWTWILQTIFLGLGIMTLYVLSLIFLFNQPSGAAKSTSSAISTSTSTPFTPATQNTGTIVGY